MTETEEYEGGVADATIQHSKSALARKNTDLMGLEMLRPHHDIFEPLTIRD